jgi:hypothetical protein
MRQPVLNDYYFCYKIPNEMAISVALSTSPSKYLFQMITNWTKDYIEARSFYKAFCARILIEKPDFNDCFELVYSFLYMYKVVKGVTDKNTKESFYSHMYHTDDDIGDLVGDIENIFNTKVFQNAFKNNIHYEIVDSVNKYESKKQDSKEVLFLNLKRTSRKKFNGFSKCLFMNSTMYRNLMNE